MDLTSSRTTSSAQLLVTEQIS